MLRWFRFSDKSYWILLFPIVWSSVPYVTYRFKTVVAFSFICCWIVLHMIRGARKNAINASLNNAFVSAVIWFLLHVFLRDVYSLLGHGMHTEYYEFAINLMMVVWFFVLHWSIIERRFEELISLTGLTMACYFIGAVFSIRGMNAGLMEGARAMMPGVSDNIDSLYKLMDSREMGMGSYGTMYGCAMAVALFAKAFLVVKDKKYKIMFLLGVLSCLTTIKSGGLGTPVVIAFFGIALAFISTMTGRRRSIIGGVTFCFMLGFIIFAFCPTIFSPFATLFEMIGETMSDGSIKDRVLSAAQAFSGDQDQYALARAQFQMRSLFGFLKSPIWGNGFIRMSEDAAGHSFILDQLSYGGILAMIPFVLFLLSIFRYYRLIGKYYFGNGWMTMPTIYVSTALMAGLMNPVFPFGFEFFLFMSGLSAMLYKHQWRRSLMMPHPFVPYGRGW